MAHLIDKDAVIAELEKLKRDAELYMTYNPENDTLYEVYKHQKALMLDLLNKLNSFNEKLVETKEVDFEKEFENFVINDPVIGDLVNFNAAEIIAKYFFELGLKAKEK